MITVVIRDTQVQTYHALYIEDDPDDRVLLEAQLELVKSFDLKLHCCHSTSEAETLLSQRGFDLIIADNKMPLTDKYGSGSNFLDRLIALGNLTPKILLSGAAPKLLHTRTQAYIEKGEIVFLHKQAINPSVLETTISMALTEHTESADGGHGLHSFSSPVMPFDGFGSTAQHVVRRLQQQYGFDLVMVTRVQGDDWIVLYAADRSYGVRAGEVLDWNDSFCKQLVAGRGPMYTSDADAIPAYQAAPIARKLEITSYLGIPICRPDGTLFGTVCAIDQESMAPSIGDEIPEIMEECQYLATILEDALQMEVLLRERQRAEQESRTDGLTGLFNRRGWEVLLQAEEDRCQRYGHVGAIIMIDLNDLKKINDSEGHEAGDRLIQAAARALSAAVRSEDVLARLGGDEFAVMAVETDSKQAQVLVDRLRKSMQAAGVSAAIGLASRDPRMTFEQAMQLADERMYEDKRARRQAQA